MDIEEDNSLTQSEEEQINNNPLNQQLNYQIIINNKSNFKNNDDSLTKNTMDMQTRTNIINNTINTSSNNNPMMLLYEQKDGIQCQNLSQSQTISSEYDIRNCKQSNPINCNETRVLTINATNRSTTTSFITQKSAYNLSIAHQSGNFNQSGQIQYSEFQKLPAESKNMIIKFILSLDIFKDYDVSTLQNLQEGSFGYVFKLNKYRLNEPFALKLMEFNKGYQSEIILTQFLYHQVAQEINQRKQKNNFFISNNNNQQNESEQQTQKLEFGDAQNQVYSAAPSLFVHKVYQVNLHSDIKKNQYRFILYEMECGTMSLRDYIHEKHLYLKQKQSRVELKSKDNIENTVYPLFLHGEIEKIMKDLIFYISVMHKNFIVHMDLKPENIVYFHKYDQWVPIDFGMCEDYRKIYSQQSKCISQNIDHDEHYQNDQFNVQEIVDYVEDQIKDEKLLQQIQIERQKREQILIQNNKIKGTYKYIIPEMLKQQSYNPFHNDSYALGNINYLFLQNPKP